MPGWTNIAAQGFESAMLICFGFGWPVAIIKTLRVKRVDGVSLSFLVLIFSGYVAGLTSKFFRAAASDSPLEAVTILYALNGIFVGTEILLYFRYRREPAPE